MKHFRSGNTDKTAFLRGAATLFDLSGTGVFLPPTSGSLEDDLEALRQDFEAVGEEFREILRTEAKCLKDADAG